MEINISLLNKFRYENLKGKGTGLNFIYVDDNNFMNTDKCVGIPNETKFYDYEVFDRLDKVLFENGKVVKAHVEDRPSKTNPLRSTKVITSIIYNNKEYKLC